MHNKFHYQAKDSTWSRQNLVEVNYLTNNPSLSEDFASNKVFLLLSDK